MLAIGNHAPKGNLLPLNTVILCVLICRNMWEMNLTPGCCCCSGRCGESLLAGAHGCPGAVSGYCSSLPALLADLSLSALTGDQSTEWLKFRTPGKARWLCCLWSSLVPVSVGVLALAIMLFLESGKMPCLYWLLRFYSSAHRKFPLFSCWKHLPVPQTQLFPLLATSIVSKLTTVLNTYKFLNYAV